MWVDHIEFENCLQVEGKKFDYFYMGLNRLADTAELCNQCKEKCIVIRIQNRHGVLQVGTSG